MLPRLMFFETLAKWEKVSCGRGYISRASGWILKFIRRLEAEKILHKLYRIDF